MARQYPRIAQTSKLRQPLFCPCGRLAAWAVEIQVNWMRGEDEVEGRCDEHKKDVSVAKTVPPTEAHLRAAAAQALSSMAADARGDEPYLPLPPLPDGYPEGFEEGYVQGYMRAQKGVSGG